MQGGGGRLRLADPVLPAFLPGEVLLDEIFQRDAADEVVQAPPGGDVPDDQDPPPVPAQRQVAEEAADAGYGLPPALAGGVLLTASCWGGGAVSRAARILLLAGAAGSVMVGLVPEDVNLSLHVLGAFVGIVVGSCGFVLAGLIRRSSPLGRLRPVTLPLSILAVTAAVLLFTGGIPAGDFGGVERLAVFPLRCWMVIAGIFLLREAARSAGAGPAS